MLISDPEVEWDIERAMQSDVNTLVSGGDSSARRAVAEWIHLGSSREGQPFRVVHSGNFDSLESLWFSARGGTVFIEELSGLTSEHQAALWQAIGEWMASPRPNRGSRLIAGSAHRLYERVTGGAFRPDLFYRLNAIHIILPRDV